MVCEILQMLQTLAIQGNQTELVCKIAIFLLKIHHGPIVANNVLLVSLRQLYKIIKVKAEEIRVSTVT